MTACRDGRVLEIITEDLSLDVAWSHLSHNQARDLIFTEK